MDIQDLHSESPPRMKKPSQLLTSKTFEKCQLYKDLLMQWGNLFLTIIVGLISVTLHFIKIAYQHHLYAEY